VIGTVECRVGGDVIPSVRTTPESIDLQRLLARMRDGGGELVAMEVTSHALTQGRVDGTRFAVAAFTNLTQDHLDYHGTMEDYFEAKALLFDPRFTRKAVVNAESEYGRRLAALAASRGLEVTTYGWGDADVGCEEAVIDESGTTAVIRTPAGRAEIRTRLVGRYNVDNLLCAAGMAMSVGLPLDAITRGAGALEKVPGRLEPVDAGQPFTVLVDYAHTPDALAHAARAARELAGGHGLIVVFGCGGDRDRVKRPLMAAAATEIADLTIITSDNPRSEDPMAIIAEIKAGASGTCRIEPDRRAAIELAIAQAGRGDVVLIAGKGHERGQTFGDRTIPFDDREVTREILEGGHGSERARRAAQDAKVNGA
jgi:UDP-N-acetylmuramoyl-L-alanyl-D-glutamate--2,6-diaminopimelate ligase